MSAATVTLWGVIDMSDRDVDSNQAASYWFKTRSERHRKNKELEALGHKTFLSERQVNA